MGDPTLGSAEKRKEIFEHITQEMESLLEATHEEIKTQE